MKLIVIAIGRMKSGPERDLAERYRTRIMESMRPLGLRALDIHELPESRARDAATRMSEEDTAMSALIPDRAILIALDERGKALGSTAFSDMIGQWRDRGAQAAVFLIGGADGLSPALRARADVTLAFGAATWPHQLARVMLYEQIYRAMTILSGHPYHRV